MDTKRLTAAGATIGVVGIMTLTGMGCAQGAGDSGSSGSGSSGQPSGQLSTQTGGEPSTASPSTTSSNAENSSASSASGSVRDDDTAEAREFLKTAKLDRSEARSAALERVPGKVLGDDGDLDSRDGAVYGVDVLGDDGRLHDVKVNAENGEVVSDQTEDDDDTADAKRLLDAARIDSQRAEDAATGVVPGRIVSSGLDEDDGAALYEVTVLGDDGDLHEVSIDPENGDVLSRHNETRDDDD